MKIYIILYYVPDSQFFQDAGCIHFCNGVDASDARLVSTILLALKMLESKKTYVID